MGSTWLSKGLYSNLLFGKISTPPYFPLISIVRHLTPIGKFQWSFPQILLIIIIIIIISNSNWTEWSTIIVISKSDKRKGRGQFEITSTITPWIVRHEVRLLINCISNNFQKKNSSENFWVKTSVALFQSLKTETSAIGVKIAWVSNYRCPITKSSNWIAVIGYSRDCVPITWQIGPRSTNHDWEFCYRCD